MSVKSKSGARNRTLLVVFLIGIVIVLVSSLFVYRSLETNDGSIRVKTAAELRDAINNASGSPVIKLNNDIVLTESLVIPANKNIILASESTTKFFKLIGVDGKNTITVNSDGVLRLDGVIVTHEGSGSGSGVFVEPDGTFIMIDGEIIGNNGWRGATGAGGGGGGGVYNCGVFTMFGGAISGNTAAIGGGVFITPGGFFEMKGGVVSDNVADYGGGVDADGTFNMSGGVVTNNVATYYGGGVYANGFFRISDGNITDNTATREGGGVYSSQFGTFNRFGGEISGNTAAVGNDVHQQMASIAR
jgi:hypothetical protein